MTMYLQSLKNTIKTISQDKNPIIYASEEDSVFKNRDESDMTRKYGALKRTSDQIYIDYSNMTVDEVVNYIMEVIK